MNINDLRALAIAGVGVLTLAPAITVLTTDAAYANNHKNDGNGNGNGNGNDRPGNSENAPGHDDDGPGNSENAPGHDDDGPGNSENAPGHVNDDGNFARELGRLNAAHASELAFLNANPDSTVGLINTYRTEAIEAEEARVRFVAARNAYDAAVDAYDGRSSGEIEDDIFALDLASEDYDADLARLNEELSLALAHEDDLRVLQDAVDQARSERDTAKTEASDALLVLTDGEPLSSGALAELERLLGL